MIWAYFWPCFAPFSTANCSIICNAGMGDITIQLSWVCVVNWNTSFLNLGQVWVLFNLQLIVWVKLYLNLYYCWKYDMILIWVLYAANKSSQFKFVIYNSIKTLFDSDPSFKCMLKLDKLLVFSYLIKKTLFDSDLSFKCMLKLDKWLVFSYLIK